MQRAVRATLIAGAVTVLVWQQPAIAKTLLPCGLDPYMPQPAAGPPAAIRVFYGSDSFAAAPAPLCPGWADKPFHVLVGTIARFTHTTGHKGLQRRVGAIYALMDILYWSTTRKLWRKLFGAATALESVSPIVPRGDFEPTELMAGVSVHFLVEERSPMNEMIYRLRVLESNERTFSFIVENLRPVRFLFQDMLDVGDYQSYFQFRRVSGSEWIYHNVLRISGERGPLSPLLWQREASYVNRAEAMYRYFVGIPTNQDPAAAE